MPFVSWRSDSVGYFAKQFHLGKATLETRPTRTDLGECSMIGWVINVALEPGRGCRWRATRLRHEESRVLPVDPRRPRPHTNDRFPAVVADPMLPLYCGFELLARLANWLAEPEFARLDPCRALNFLYFKPVPDENSSTTKSASGGNRPFSGLAKIALV